MGIENVWENDVFSMFELSNSIMTLPVVPSRCEELGIFTVQGVKTTSVVLENKDGLIGLVPDTPRGAPGRIAPVTKRDARAYALTHLVEPGSVKADDVQNVRAFGSETELQQISGVVNDKLEHMKINLAATREHLRVGALSGVIYDADGVTELANLFSDFGVVQTEYDFLLGTATTDVRGMCMQVKRAIEDALGTSPYREVRVFATDTFFDAFCNHDNVREAYANWASNEWMRNDVRAGFPFGGIIWENYDPKVGVYHFIPDGDARAFPTGTPPNVFKEFVGPADYVETVNTIGREYYAKQQNQDFDKGVDLEAQSNPLPLCARPQALVRIFSSN